MPDLSFDEAVQHATHHHGAAYAFVPEGEPPRGGKLYVLAYNDMIERDPDEWPYILWYSVGLFGSSSGEEGSYGPDSIPDGARSLMFTIAPSFDPSFTGLTRWVSVRVDRPSTAHVRPARRG